MEGINKNLVDKNQKKIENLLVLLSIDFETKRMRKDKTYNHNKTIDE